jgi:ferredoxin-NADP reductase
VRALVVKKNVVATDVIEVVFASCDRPFPEYTPGSHIDVSIPGLGKRQYSLTGRGSEYTIAIQKERLGRGGSAYLHDMLAVGDVIEISTPRNNFELFADKPLLFVAGGIGITPFLSMLPFLDPGQFKLLYFCRSDDRVILRDRLADFERNNSAQIFINLSPAETIDVIARFIIRETNPMRIYCCGPGKLNDAVRDLCKDQVDVLLHSESFVAAAPTRSVSSGFYAVIASSGRRLHISPETTLLEALRNAGIEVDSSCESGLCGTCKIPYGSGVIDHRDLVLSADERKTHLLACCSRAISGELLLKI